MFKIILIPYKGGKNDSTDCVLAGGLKRGAIVIISIVYSCGQIMYERPVNVHRTLYDMRYNQDEKLIYTVGREGNMKIIDPAPTRDYEQKMRITFKYPELSCNLFVSDTEIIVGEKDGGSMQYIKFEVKNFTITDSQIFAFHEGEITALSSYSDPDNDKTYFLSYSKKCILAYWDLTKNSPLKVFNLIIPSHKI